MLKQVINGHKLNYYYYDDYRVRLLIKLKNNKEILGYDLK